MTSTADITLDGDTLTVESTQIALTPQPDDALAHVWQVPEAYRADGYYVSLQRPGDPRERPACAGRDAQYLGAINYPADRSKRLDAAKQQKHQARIEALEAAREAGFDHNDQRIASDTKSQALLTALNNEASLAILSGDQAQLDQFADGLGAGWRAVDGTIVATTAAEFRSMMQSWYAHVAATDAVSQQHKAAINAAATFDELNAIDVAAGYDDAD